jgi:hypothetical protein
MLHDRSATGGDRHFAAYRGVITLPAVSDRLSAGKD